MNGRFDSRFLFKAATSVTQQVKINLPASQSVTEAGSQQVQATLPAKEILFDQAILSAAIFNVNKSGPVITPDVVDFYDDRFATHTKWYFPEFALQQPQQDSFLFTCYEIGKDADAKPVYNAEAILKLQKNIPTKVKDQIDNSQGTSFNEISVNDLTFCFQITLADDPIPLRFPCTFVQSENTFTLTIKLAQQVGLIRFYKFISDAGNKTICSIQVNGTYFGYTRKPSPIELPIYRQAYLQNHAYAFKANSSALGNAGMAMRFRFQPGSVANSEGTDNYITNDAMPFVKQIADDVTFDCHEFPNNYLIRGADNSVNIFACKPPFGDGSLAKNEYNKFHIIHGSLADPDTGVSAVYINVYNGNYLVTPNNYKIALDETDGNTLIPAAYLFTKIDANNISNSVAMFKFNIAPAISGFQILLLKKLLLQNTPTSLNKTPDDIFVEFPAKIHQPELIQFNKDQIPNIEIAMMGAYAHGVQACNFLSLEFQNVNIGNGNAALIANRLKRTEGRMIENIVFDVDSDTDTNPQASIVLSLEDITGKGLTIQQDAKDPKIVYLINRTLLQISASGLADKNDDPKQLGPPPVTINPNQAVSTASISDVTEIPFTEFEYKYTAVENTGAGNYKDNILKEVRTDAGQVVKDDIIVTNNTGLFSLYNIDHIDFILSIVNPEDPEHPLYTTNVISLAKDKDGEVTFIDFMLPVVAYLSKWSVIYSTLIHFADNTTQQNDLQHIEDINSVGKLINLTVSNLNLHKP